MIDVTQAEPHQPTMARLEAAKRRTDDGVDFWMARDLGPVLGYDTFAKFENVIERAKAAMIASGIDPSHQIVQTGKLMGVGRGATYEGRDFFLSRGASYLIAMNGDPSKPEVAAAQVYFASKTREREIDEGKSEDQKRLDLREKVTQSHKRVSSVAKTAGVRSYMQGIFHDAVSVASTTCLGQKLRDRKA